MHNNFLGVRVMIDFSYRTPMCSANYHVLFWPGVDVMCMHRQLYILLCTQEGCQTKRCYFSYWVYMWQGAKGSSRFHNYTHVCYSIRYVNVWYVWILLLLEDNRSFRLSTVLYLSNLFVGIFLGRWRIQWTERLLWYGDSSSRPLRGRALQVIHAASYAISSAVNVVLFVTYIFS